MSQQIEELGLTSAVTLAGHRPNPYVIVANSDCFVLSSDYEGQPMVLLEALILGRPIVTTSFGSVRGALPEGYGMVVARDTEALAEGMRSFLRGQVVAKPFDYAAYNRVPPTSSTARSAPPPLSRRRTQDAPMLAMCSMTAVVEIDGVRGR